MVVKAFNRAGVLGGAFLAAAVLGLSGCAATVTDSTRASASTSGTRTMW